MYLSNLNHIAGTIKNLISDLVGVTCDGAKESCALKLSTAARTAVQSALFSLHGINLEENLLTPNTTTKLNRISWRIIRVGPLLKI